MVLRRFYMTENVNGTRDLWSVYSAARSSRRRHSTSTKVQGPTSAKDGDYTCRHKVTVVTRQRCDVDIALARAPECVMIGIEMSRD